MITTVNRDMFVNGIRSVRPTNFTCEGLHALFDFFESLEDDTGEQIEFDPIAICCEWTEYGSISEYNQNYGSDVVGGPGIKTLDELEDITTVIRLDFGFIILDH
tara:strand:- start:441 stop:752 length:312 start_codon:yes stop_codon:yes gene_type:complete